MRSWPLIHRAKRRCVARGIDHFGAGLNPGSFGVVVLMKRAGCALIELGGYAPSSSSLPIKARDGRRSLLGNLVNLYCCNATAFFGTLLEFNNAIKIHVSINFIGHRIYFGRKFQILSRCW